MMSPMTSVGPPSDPATSRGSHNYTFDLDDGQKWLSYLREHGYVVLKKMLSSQDVEEVKNLMWDDICGAHHISRHDTSTWNKWRLPYHGIDASMAQTAGPWHVRGNANIQTAFSMIWNAQDLITSMDAVIMWRSDLPHDTEGLHLDQNPFTKPYLDCVQGMVPLLPVTRDTGGLQVVAFSHTDETQKRFCEKYPEKAWDGDFIVVPDDPANELLLECDPGDLILWDSRTIHGGEVGPKAACLPDETPHLTRMSVTVAMTPRSRASDEVQDLRCRGFANGISFNHCPHEAGSSTGMIHAKRKKGHKKFELNESQRVVL